MDSDSGEAARAYNVDTYVAGINAPFRARFPAHPVRAGTRAPAFRLPLVDGGMFDLEAVLGSGQHVVLLFGCYTAPPLLAEAPALEALHQQFGHAGFMFVFVYTREIHPGEHVPAHRSLEQKGAHARRLQDAGGWTFPVAIDALAGTVHQAYGTLPNMACVVHRDGTVVYRSSWIDVMHVRQMLLNLVARDERARADKPGLLVYSEALVYKEGIEASTMTAYLDSFGPKARLDDDRAGRRLGPV